MYDICYYASIPKPVVNPHISSSVDTTAQRRPLFKYIWMDIWIKDGLTVSKFFGSSSMQCFAYE